ncbi:MAG: hypothetical protein HYS98_02065, partial [Deltaproteobacteria bacterium]|nr:hypothetical protein [Deltaproteobacteria bacterium]
MATPFLQALRKAYPNTSITLYGKSMFKDLLEGAPYYDDYISIQYSLWREAYQLRSAHFDIAFLCPNSLSSALVTSLATIPVRIGYARYQRRTLLTHPITLSQKYFHGKVYRYPMTEYYLDLLALASHRESNEVRHGNL